MFAIYCTASQRDNDDDCDSTDGLKGYCYYFHCAYYDDDEWYYAFFVLLLFFAKYERWRRSNQEDGEWQC